MIATEYFPKVTLLLCRVQVACLPLDALHAADYFTHVRRDQLCKYLGGMNKALAEIVDEMGY